MSLLHIRTNSIYYTLGYDWKMVILSYNCSLQNKILKIVMLSFNRSIIIVLYILSTIFEVICLYIFIIYKEPISLILILILLILLTNYLTYLSLKL